MAKLQRDKGDLKQLLQLSSLLKPYKKVIAIALVALLIASGGVLVLGQGLRAVIDKGLSAASVASLDQAMLGFISVVFIMAIATYVRFYCVSWLGERVIADLRRKVFAHLLTLSPEFYETMRTGEAVSRLSSDTTILETVVGSSLSMALRSSVMMIGGIVLLFFTSIKLTLFVLLGVPLVMGPILIFGRKVRKLAKDAQDRLGDASAFIDESLHEIRTVQSSVAEVPTGNRFNGYIEAVFSSAKARIRARALLIAGVIFLAFGAIGFILWTGGRDVIHGAISAGELSAFVFYAVIVASAVGTISEVIGDLQRAAGATERLLHILNTEPSISLPATPVSFRAPVSGHLQFKNVQFFYPSRPDSAALDEFSLSIKPGERVALVGPSGAGKTTVFQLLSRFYDPQKGDIYLDDVSIRDVTPQRLREQLALVPQDPVIFAATVRENVRFARPEASDDEVLNALKAAHALEFVERMPEGMDSELGERGVKLSGGQRQRLAIARAILANRPILLLDEATSALDAESEFHVQAALEHLMKGKTSLVIAHRLATVRHAHRIILMEHGRILAQGTHDELVVNNPLYARLAELQFLHA